MMLVYVQYPDILDEAPGLGDLKTTPPTREGYVSCPRDWIQPNEVVV